jgi:hypothetical protein
MFLTFKDLPNIKQSQAFCYVIFWEIEDCEKKKSMGNARVGKEDPPCGTEG